MKEKIVPTQGPMISFAALGRKGLKKDFRYLKALRHDLFYRALAHLGRLPLLTLGDAANSFAWQVCPEKLGQNSTVVSAGVGRDISFELALVHLFNCRILLLDPSPTGISTMSMTKNQHPNIQFLPLALTGRDGSVTMCEPGNPEEGSYSSLIGVTRGPKVEGISLSSLIKRHRLDKIDLLKMDIEGSEYNVIESVLKEKLKITQICVEYHNQVLPGIKTSWTAGSLIKLWLAGWRLISKYGSSHTLWNDRFGGLS
jgi:FkbM family methyltransferase